MRFAVLFVLLCASSSAGAASFDCKRVATVTERTICAEPALSSLDERAVAAYTAAIDALGISDDERDPVGDLLLKGHGQWNAARNRCAAASTCLLQQYLRRIAVLEFKPDSQAPSPLDPITGRYGTTIEPVRELVIMAAPGGLSLVRVTVTSADWNCAFNGIGRPDKAGALRVVRADFDKTTQGDHALILTPTRLGLTIRHADPKDDVSARFCGAGGSLEHPFPRRQ